MPKPRGVLIAGNWKMNQGPTETEGFFSKLRSLSKDSLLEPAREGLVSGMLEACVFPPAVSLETAVRCTKTLGFPMVIGAQNAHWEKKGAFTGELSGPLLSEIGVHWALVGHSERRQHFGETDETVRKRAIGLLEQGFRVILCIGETRAERESGQTERVLVTQIQRSLPEAGTAAAHFLNGRLVIAYEPVWAIGTGLTATPAQAEEAHQIIRKEIWNRFGMEASGKTPLLYGGSVTPENAAELLRCPNVDGALVGGASLKAESFLSLLNAAGEA